MVLKDSDDYELIITCPSEHVEKIRTIITSINNDPVTEVGRMTHASEGIKLVCQDETRRNITPSGWDHFMK